MTNLRPFDWFILTLSFSMLSFFLIRLVKSLDTLALDVRDLTNKLLAEYNTKTEIAQMKVEANDIHNKLWEKVDKLAEIMLHLQDRHEQFTARSHPVRRSSDQEKLREGA